MNTTAKLSLLLVFFSTSVLAQDYRAFLQEGKQWEMHHWMIPVATAPPSANSSHYFLRGDTLINDVVYQVLYVSRTGELNYDTYEVEAYPQEEIITYPFMALREDEQEKKVFGFGIGDNAGGHHDWAAYTNSELGASEEYLVYDFGLPEDSIGKVVEISLGHHSILDSITTIDLGDGIVRRQWHFMDINNWHSIGYSSLVEGVGSMSSIIYPWNSLAPEGSGEQVNDHLSLHCYSELGNRLYPEFIVGDTCTPGSPKSIAETHMRGGEKVKLYPNPGDGNVLFSSPIQGEVHVYNLTNELVHAEVLSNQKSMDLQHLAAGIYMLRLPINSGAYGIRLVIQ